MSLLIIFEWKIIVGINSSYKNTNGSHLKGAGGYTTRFPLNILTRIGKVWEWLIVYRTQVSLNTWGAWNENANFQFSTFYKVNYVSRQSILYKYSMERFSDMISSISLMYSVPKEGVRMENPYFMRQLNIIFEKTYNFHPCWWSCREFWVCSFSVGTLIFHEHVLIKSSCFWFTHLKCGHFQLFWYIFQKCSFVLIIQLQNYTYNIQAWDKIWNRENIFQNERTLNNYKNLQEGAMPQNASDAQFFSIIYVCMLISCSVNAETIFHLKPGFKCVEWSAFISYELGICSFVWK